MRRFLAGLAVATLAIGIGIVAYATHDDNVVTETNKIAMDKTFCARVEMWAGQLLEKEHIDRGMPEAMSILVNTAAAHSHDPENHGPLVYATMFYPFWHAYVSDGQPIGLVLEQGFEECMEFKGATFETVPN